MYITIVTKVLSATSTKPTRIVASNSDGKRVVISYPQDVRPGEEAHFEAVKALCAKLRWNGEVVSGEIKPGVLAWNFVALDGENQFLLPKVTSGPRNNCGEGS